VSHDVPLARPPRRLSRLWARRVSLWDANVVLINATTIGYVGLTDRHSGAARMGAIALVGGLTIWYLAFGRRLIRNEISDWRGYLYVTGAAGLFLASVWLVNGTGFVLWALCPQPFMLMNTRRATAAVALFNAGYVLVSLARIGNVADTLTGPLPAAVFAVIASTVFGTWASAIAQQNDERARLIAELEDSRAEIGRLSHEAGVAAERQRLAGEIHDTIAQGLSSVVMLVQAATAELDRDLPQARRHLDLAVNTARENLGDARALVAELTPTALDGSSLVEALGRLVARFGAETGLRASFGAEGPATALPPPVEVVLLRAAQESLANVRKHAAASEVHMRLSRVDGAVTLETADDGAGFTPSGGTAGYGLRAMRARVGEASGTLTVESAPGRGTTVRVEVPVP
jgi:signal transduction histidine kinase